MTSDHKEITAKPSEIIKIIRNARGRASFFVHGTTEILVKDRNTYLPLAGNVKVTRKAMLQYLTDIQETASQQEVHRDIELEISISIYGTCYFV